MTLTYCHDLEFDLDLNIDPDPDNNIDCNIDLHISINFLCDFYCNLNLDQDFDLLKAAGLLMDELASPALIADLPLAITNKASGLFQETRIFDLRSYFIWDLWDLYEIYVP